MTNLFSMIFVLIGGVNWFLVGAFEFDLVSWLFGGPTTVLARVVYILIGISALWITYILMARRGVINCTAENTGIVR